MEMTDDLKRVSKLNVCLSPQLLCRQVWNILFEEIHKNVSLVFDFNHLNSCAKIDNFSDHFWENSMKISAASKAIFKQRPLSPFG